MAFYVFSIIDADGSETPEYGEYAARASAIANARDHLTFAHGAQVSVGQIGRSNEPTDVLWLGAWTYDGEPRWEAAE